MHVVEKSKEELATEVAYLRQRVAELETAETERTRSEEWLVRLNESFLEFGADPLENINHLVALCGELLGATCALYNRLDGELLCSVGQWNTPPGYNPVDKPDGHICYDVIKRGGDQVLVIRKLHETSYAQTDPNVAAYKLQTYVGRAVKFGDAYVGSLCIVYQEDFVPSEREKRLIGLIASAIGVEEKRKQAEEALKLERDRLQMLMEGLAHIEIGIDVVGVDYRVRLQNRVLEERFGDLTGKLCYENYMDLKEPCDFCPMIKAVENNRVEHMELTGGDGRHYELISAPLSNPDGTVDKAIEVIRDITERKMMEDKLEESEERFRTIFEGAPDAIFLTDPESGEIIDANSAALQLLLRPREEILGLHQSKLHPPQLQGHEKKKFVEYVQYVRAKKQTHPIESTVVRSDGSIVPVEILAQMIQIKGRPIFQGTFRDITERKRAEEELRKSEGRYRSLFENSQDAILLTAPDGSIFDVNPAACKMLGRTAEEIKQIGRDGLVDATDPRLDAALKERTRRGKARAEIMMIRADGTTFPVEITSTIFTDEQGQPRTSMIIRDVTERKRAEEELREAAEQYNLITNTSMDGFAKHDLDGRILDVNEAYCHMLGYSKEELLKMTVTDIETIATADEIKKKINKIMEVGLDRFESRHRCKDGHIIDVEISMTLLRQSAQILVFLRDITERKQAQEELRQSEERYRFLFENSQSINILIGTDEKILDVNESAAQSLGYKKKNIIGKKVLEFVIPAQREKVAEQSAQELRGDYTPPLEIDILTQKGTRTLLFTKGHATLFEKGELIGMLLSAVDITERKKTEDELKIKNNAIASSTTAVTIGEFGGNLTYVNPAFLHMWGYDDAKEVLGRPAVAFWHDQKKAREVIEALLKGEVVVEELVAKRKDGSLFDVQLSASIVTDEVGNPICMMASFVDITERKQAEEALRVSEERFRTIFETARDFIFIKDKDSKFTAVNPAMEQLYGVPASKLIGKTGAALFGKATVARLREKDVRALKGEIIIEEHPSPAKGSMDIHHIIKVPIRNSAGEIIGICGIGRDITERKQMEDALRESEERFRTIVEQAAEAIVAHDLDGQVLLVNSLACEYTGYSQEELLSMNVLNLDHKILEKDHKRKYWEKLQIGKYVKVETTHIRKDGSTYEAEIYLVKIIFKGQPIILCLARDITERKQMEEHLRESEERFRLLVEHSVDAFILHDIDGRIVDVNQHTCDSLGYTREELLGLYVHDIDQNIAPGMHMEQWEQMAPGHPITLEGVHRRKDGSTFPVEVRLGVFESGGRKLMLRLVRDVTERKEAEEALREREAFNYALFHYNPVETIVVDLEGKVTAFNLAKEDSGDRLPAIGDRMYKDYAAKHEIDMNVELMKCIRSGKRKEFPERKYGDRYLNITVSPFPQGAIIISEDITKRKRAEEALRESEQFSSTLLNDSPHPILVVNPDTSLRYVNPALEMLTGFSAAELLGRKVPYPWWPKGTSRKTTRDLQEAMRKSHQRTERNFQKKSGERFWVEITSIPAMRDGEVQYLLGNWIDITERKQAEELLQKERDTFYTILDRAPYGVMVINKDGNHSFVNPEFTNITGYTLEEIPTTKEWLRRAYPHQHYRNMVTEMWETDYTQSKAVETFRKQFGRVFSRAFSVICKDGAAKEIDFRTSVISDEETILMLSDITDRKRMHGLLETAAAEWRTTFDAISDAVCLLDPYGKIIRCNNAMLKLMGRPFSQITNHHCWEVMHGVSEVPRNCPITRVGKTHHRETEIMPKDSRWFNVSVDPLLDEDGNFIGGVHIMSDITERKQIEDELQNSRAQLRNLTTYLESVRERERTNIAREIHDELAQALTALKMDLSWLDHRLPRDPGSLIEKTKSMSNLIDSTIHTVKRISAELRPGILDDLGLVAAIEWQAEEFQNRTGIRCRITVDPEDITMDQDRATAIFRIFQETLTNVARHARATRVAVKLKERAGKLTLRVRDNGIGITEEQISDPQSFGLIGMQERIILWGGKIRFKGIPDKGTTVLVSVGLDHSKKDIEKN